MKEKNTSAMVSIDLMVALVLLIAAVTLALMIMPSISHEDRDWRIKQYMTATRASDNLVQSTGDEGWENEWAAQNFSNVSIIGLIYAGNEGQKQKVLDYNKIKKLMGDPYKDNELNWWEFPGPSTSRSERDNAARALGLAEYNFYMQLHPVGLEITDFNSTLTEINLNKQTINFETAAVIDRYVYIKDGSGYLKDRYGQYTLHYRLNLWVW